MPDLSEIACFLSLIGIEKCACRPACRFNAALFAAVKTPTAIRVLRTLQQRQTIAAQLASALICIVRAFQLIRHFGGVYGEAGITPQELMITLPARAENCRLPSPESPFLPRESQADGSSDGDNRGPRPEHERSPPCAIHTRAECEESGCA